MKFREIIKKVKSYLSMNWKISFFITGIASTVWFLIRVIPKPSRAAYPCMRTVAPLMSGFVVYLLSLVGSVLVFRKFKKNLISTRYKNALILFSILIIFLILASISRKELVTAANKGIKLMSAASFVENSPTGVAKGLFPGRVVWLWDRNATDSTMTNSSGDYWYQNANQSVIDSMLKDVVMNYADTNSVSAAWEALIKYFNSNHEKGMVGYMAGEKIWIKLNLTTSCCGAFSDDYEKHNYVTNMDATPQLVLALIKQLVNDLGVSQSDIYIGDPFRRFHNLYWNTCHSVFPDIHYMDEIGTHGRELTTLTADPVLKFSDGTYESQIPEIYEDCDYFINMACLKSHDAGGITLCAKNHQGSIIQQGTAVQNQSAQFMHYALPVENPGYGKYRHLVDFMGHELLG